MKKQLTDIEWANLIRDYKLGKYTMAQILNITDGQEEAPEEFHELGCPCCCDYCRECAL